MSLMVGLGITFVLAIPTLVAFSIFRCRVRHNTRVSRGRGAAFALWLLLPPLRRLLLAISAISSTPPCGDRSQ